MCVPTLPSLNTIQSLYTPAIRDEAALRFGFDPQTLEELDGSAFVYEGLSEGQARILKITPGLHNTSIQVMGSTEEQILAQMDFELYLAQHKELLAQNNVALALPVPSKSGSWVETIPLDGQAHACFLVTCYDKAPGFMYPDEDEVVFPEEILVTWGRTAGLLHHLSIGFQPAASPRRRVPWEEDDLLDDTHLIPAEQTLVHQRFAEMIERLHSLPTTPDVYGLMHCDLHHGNFFVDQGRLIVFDFDAASYFWFSAEIAIALHNCLPLPRQDTARRSAYASRFLEHFLRGYRQVHPLDPAWFENTFPLFMEFCQLVNYTYFYKYWDMNNLSPRRQKALAEMRQRIETRFVG